MTRRTDDAVGLALARELLESVAEEIAEVCVRTAVSPNIKERRDLSAAVFDGRGRMVAQAAHIPVHLGAMPYSVKAVLERMRLEPGDVALVNDPYAGGTHLPDVTAVAPVPDETGRAVFHVAVRAHHADIGGAVPGSMAPQDEIFAEGLRIPPVRWVRGGMRDPDVTALLLANVRDPAEREADLLAQVGALERGARRLLELGETAGGLAALAREGRRLIEYAARRMRAALTALPDGRGRAKASLEIGDAVIAVALEKAGDHLRVDFRGTSPPVGAGLNAPRAVTESAVYHLLRCLGPADAPANDGLLRAAAVEIPSGSLLDARVPHPVAGGNVETSQRVVDVLWLAAARIWPDRIPAPGCGTMSNWTFGATPAGPSFPSFYETLPGGAGGGPDGAGADAIQQHMTNTRSTPTEVLERRWPVRVERLELRPASGGAGRHPGGRGLVKEVRFLAPAVVAVLMSRHRDPPPGVAGGSPGRPGRLTLVREGHEEVLAARATLELLAGDRLRIETPGGGGWGRPRRVGPASGSG